MVRRGRGFIPAMTGAFFPGFYNFGQFKIVISTIFIISPGGRVHRPHDRRIFCQLVGRYERLFSFKKVLFKHARVLRVSQTLYWWGFKGCLGG